MPPKGESPQKYALNLRGEKLLQKKEPKKTTRNYLEPIMKWVWIVM